jgi:hypothetical protein
MFDESSCWIASAVKALGGEGCHALYGTEHPSVFSMPCHSMHVVPQLHLVKHALTFLPA